MSRIKLPIIANTSHTSSTFCVEPTFPKGKSHVLNPFKRPKDSELPVLQTCQKVDGRINLIHKMKQPLYKKTARESKADPFDILRSIPDFCHLQELPSTPTSLIQKDPKVAQAMAIGEKLKNLETAKDFVVAKREIFLIQYLIGVKKDELMRIKNLQISEGRKLDKAELRLETDAINFDRFLKNSDHETMDCLKQVEIESKLKWDKITEIQKLNVQIVTIRNKLRKLEEIITEYKSYEKFLTNVAPQEWKDRKARERQIAAAKLSRMGKQSEYSILDVAIRQRSASITSGKGYKKIRKRPSKRFDLGGDADNSSDSGSVGLPHSDPPSEDEEEKADIYFTKPQQLLDIFDEMEERSIRMIQKSEDNEDAIYELRASFRLTKRKMTKEIEVLKQQTRTLEKLVSRENEKANDYKFLVKLFSFGEYSEQLQDEMSTELHSKVEVLYNATFEQNDANMDVLQMMTAIENKVEELVQFVDGLPPEAIEEAEKQRQRNFRQQQRELKLKLQEEMNAERIRRAIEKALTAEKHVTRRKLMFRSKPPMVLKQKVVKKPKWRAREDEEMVYFFS